MSAEIALLPDYKIHEFVFIKIPWDAAWIPQTLREFPSELGSQRATCLENTTAYLSLYEYVHTVVMLVFGESYESTAAGEYCPTGPLRGELLFLRIVLKSLKNIT